MSAASWILPLGFVAVVVALGRPLGVHLGRVLTGAPHALSRALGPVERALLRAIGVRHDHEQSAGAWAASVLAFHLLGVFAVTALTQLQGRLPGNPRGFGPTSLHVGVDTAVSFVTNTNWQAYGGETTLSYLTQAVGLTTQNFVSAASGIAVMAALARGFSRERVATLGSFWVDLVRVTVHVLLPLSVVLALALVSQGVVQTFSDYPVLAWLDGATTATGERVREGALAVGPAASQIAIKQLGTNGGGFFNVNGAHPLENPTPASNAIQLVAILLLPAACVVAFGRLVGDGRQARALLAAMALLFVPVAMGTIAAESHLSPALSGLSIDAGDGALGALGNAEGKEVRFGAATSALWATATTAASNGSVNAMHDSFTPLGGLGPLWLMQIGEVAFGGVGSGVYGMVLYAVAAVFLAGLMVGRTPEYLGKKVGPREVKLTSLGLLLPAVGTLAGAAIACLVPAGTATLGNGGPHGFSEVLYAFSSGANNNGSAFGGLDASGPFYAWGMALAMLVGRFGVMLPVLGIAGALAEKGRVPLGPGTLPTHGPLFVFVLVGVVVLFGALGFLPALALGPIAEHLVGLPGGAP